MNVLPEEFRDTVSNWASGVAVVAVREDDRVIAVTVTALLSLSLDPPRLLFTLGPNATVRPFLQVGTPVGVSILAASQRRLASVFADPFPVGPDPFTAQDTPLIAGAAAAFGCRVQALQDGGDHLIVIADVITATATGEAPLLRHRGRYRVLD